MSNDKDGEGQGEAPAKPRRTRSGTSRNKRAADASKEGMGEVLPLHPNRAAGLQAGVEAQVERGKIPRDPDYVSRAKLFQQGLLLPEDMDMEELERLQFRDRHGNMAGRPPKLSAAQQRAIHAEWLRRIGKMYEGGLEFAIRALIKTIPLGLLRLSHSCQSLASQEQWRGPSRPQGFQGTTRDSRLSPTR